MLRSNLSLRRIPLFAALPPTALDALAAMLRELTYPVGALLCAEGEYSELLYIVLQGSVEVITALGTADERLIAIREAGAFYQVFTP